MPGLEHTRQNGEGTERFLKLSRSNWPMCQGRLGVYERQELAQGLAERQVSTRRTWTMGGNQTWGPAGNFCFLPVTVTNQGYDRPLVYHDNPGLKPGEW